MLETEALKNGIEGKALVLHVTEPGSIPGILYSS